MKKIIILLLLSLFVFTSCNQKDEILGVTLKGKKVKTTICHYNSNNDTWKTISVNEKQLAKHLEHGDRRAPCGYTYVPDDTFEQRLIFLGYDDVLDDYVLTSNINAVTSLGFEEPNEVNPILDFTGIEDFIALEDLFINGHRIANLDLSNQLNLREVELIYIFGNQSLDLSNKPALTRLSIIESVIESVNLSNNTALSYLNISSSPGIASLDLSSCTALSFIDLAYLSSLTDLNIKNGNNSLITTFNVFGNPNLVCIQVDDATYFTSIPTDIDPWTTLSEDCGY